MPLLTTFDVVLGYTPDTETRVRSTWPTMNIVDLAEEIATDPVMTDCFRWSLNHGNDEMAGTFIAGAAAAIVTNAGSARTKTGRKIKFDQALSVLRTISKKAHQTGPEYQEMWCIAIANVVVKNSG